MHLYLEHSKQHSSHHVVRLVLAGERMQQYFIPSQIIRLEAENSYTRIFCVGQRPHITCKVLKSYEELLKPLGFIRTHHSHLVNRHFINSVNRDFIVLKDLSTIDLSRRKRKSVIQQIHCNCLDQTKYNAISYQTAPLFAGQLHQA